METKLLSESDLRELISEVFVIGYVKALADAEIRLDGRISVSDGLLSLRCGIANFQTQNILAAVKSKK